jgi:hypothetical protein
MMAERGPVIMLALYTEKIPGTGIRYSDRRCNATYLPTYLPTDWYGTIIVVLGRIRSVVAACRAVASGPSTETRDKKCGQSSQAPYGFQDQNEHFGTK